MVILCPSYLGGSAVSLYCLICSGDLPPSVRFLVPFFVRNSDLIFYQTAPKQGPKTPQGDWGRQMDCSHRKDAALRPPYGYTVYIQTDTPFDPRADVSKSLHFLCHSSGHLVSVLRRLRAGLLPRIRLRVMAVWLHLSGVARGNGMCHSH